VEDHPNVTILFADIVNYTAMTTQLNVIDLLDILNELFGRFDDASEVNLLRYLRTRKYVLLIFSEIESAANKIFGRLLLLCCRSTSRSRRPTCRSVC
jgi:hypothetical protein